MREGETLFGDAHLDRYRETGGDVGHIWRRGSRILLDRPRDPSRRARASVAGRIRRATDLGG